MAGVETPESIDAAARILGIAVPEACREGIAQNLDLLRRHVAVLEACPPDADAPA